MTITFSGGAQITGGISTISPPTLSLDFTTGTLDSRITFSRGTTGTYTSSNGTIQTAAINTPRFEYDARTLVPRGLLMEDQRSNYAIYSNDLTNAVWVATNCSVAKTATGPDGVTNSATTITSSSSNATILQTVNDGVSSARITTCYIRRRSGLGEVQITQDNGSTWTTVTFTSSWTRVQSPVTTSTNPIIGLRIVNSGDSIDVWGFQNERGSSATSVIPTIGSILSRGADLAVMTGTNFSDWFNSVQGSFCAEYSTDVTSGAIWAATDGTASNRIYGLISSNYLPAMIVSTGGVQQVLISNPAFTINSLTKTAWGYETNNFAVVTNGDGIATDTSGTLPIVDRFNIGNLNNTARINGCIKSIEYYNIRLSNTQLQGLSKL